MRHQSRNKTITRRNFKTRQELPARGVWITENMAIMLFVYLMKSCQNQFTCTHQIPLPT